jgi:hypothetical protein
VNYEWVEMWDGDGRCRFYGIEMAPDFGRRDVFMKMVLPQPIKSVQCSEASALVFQLVN